MNRLKVAVIGHSSRNSITPKAKEFSNKIIEFVRKYDYSCLSGGCNGIIEYVNKELSSSGNSVIYYSPSKSIEEHNKLYDINFPNAQSKHFDCGDDLNFSFIYRSLELIKDSDIVVCFYGTWGTLGELDFAVMLGKTIIFIEEPGRQQLHDIYKIIDNLSEYNYNEKVYVAKDDKELELILEKVREDFDKR